MDASVMGSPCFELGRDEIKSNLKLSKNMEKIKIEIKNRWTGSVLFEYEKEENTIKDTLVEAVNNGAYLGGADLGGADLRGAKDVPFIPMACPTDGEFIGWKKVYDNGITYLVRLLILEDAKRSSATGRKCRCSKARVMDISVLQDGKEGPKECKIINTSYDPYVTYEVGKVVEPDSFDDDRFNECSHGIHFFIDKQEAINYLI